VLLGKIVYFHHPAYTTALHDPPSPWMAWPFQSLGASIVMSGHEHLYERIQKSDGMTYIIHGLSGHPWIYSLDGCTPIPGSVVRYNDDHGVLLGVATQNQLTFCFYSLNGTIVDQFTLSH